MARQNENRAKGVRATSFDVAERAGVSQSTVSRALSGAPNITSSTRERVAMAARELGYVVDHRASLLRKGKANTIAIVILRQSDETVLTSNPFYFELLGAICEAAAERGKETLVSIQSEDSQLFGDYIGRGQADGTIVIGSATNRKAWAFFRELQQRDDRIVFWGSPFDEAHRVRSDNFAGGQMAARYLLDCGYRRIGFIGPKEAGHTQFRERFDGYCVALEGCALPPIQLEQYPDQDRIGQGRHAVRELRKMFPDIDALFAASDRLAFGALEELKAAGLSVPDDIGLIGFDGMASGTVCTPALTTIAPDLEIAAEMLLCAVLDDDNDSQNCVPVRLVERSSVRRAGP